MNPVIYNVGVASQIGAYSDAVEVAPNLRWLLTSGTPGLSLAGDIPKNIAGRRNWRGATSARCWSAPA
jgi:2-iminobutanoate/2-iminopropanoate deaminase